jgi:ankyrin
LVYCIIDSVDECLESQRVIQHIEEFAELTNNRLKLLLAGISLPESTLEPSQFREIVFGESSKDMLSSKKQYVKARIRDLASENSAWHGLEDVAVSKLDVPQDDSSFLLLKLNMLLLEWSSRYCTKRDLREKIQRQPEILTEYYSYVMAAIDDDVRPWVTKVLRWIVYAVRPFRPNELALAVAIEDAAAGLPPWKADVLDDLGDLIHQDIIGDLRHFMVPLVKIEDNRVYLIHDTFRVFLVNEFAKTAKAEDSKSTPNLDSIQEELADDQFAHVKPVSVDEHYHILFHCLEYLQNVGRRCSTSIGNGTQWSLSTDGDFGLISYASLHWPYHFKETCCRITAHDYVLKFLKDDKTVEIWTNFYHQLKPSLKSSIRLDNPLKIVCRFGLMDLVEECIKTVNSSKNLQEMHESLDLAAQYGHNDIVQTLLEDGVRSPNALGLAAEGGFEDVVESLLAIDPGPNNLDELGYAPLHRATCGGHNNIISLLLIGKAADPNVSTMAPTNFQSLIAEPRRRSRYRRRSVSDSDSESDTDQPKPTSLEIRPMTLPRPVWSETSLHLTALTGQIEIATNLLANGADIQMKNSLGYDALKYAALGGFPEMVVLLLDKNAGEDKASASDGNTALHLAVAYGHYKAADMILQKANHTLKLISASNTEGLTPIHIAAREGHLNLLNLMTRFQDEKSEAASIGSTDKDDKHLVSTSPIIADNGPSKLRSFKYKLRKMMAPPRRRKSTDRRSPERKSQADHFVASKDHVKSALELAAENGHLHIVQALLARSNTQDRAFSMNMAAQNGHTSIVTTLLDEGPTHFAVDSHQNTALHLAAKRGNLETLAVLLTHPQLTTLFQIDATEKRGMTPLHVTAQAGHADVVDLLLEHKANPDHKDKSSRIALQLAAGNGHLACVDILLQLEDKDYVGSTDNEGSTALHYAARKCRMAVVKRLCAFKHIIWLKDESNDTAFDLLVARGTCEDTQEFIHILEQSADGETEFARGGLPLHVAARRGNMDLLHLLLDNGWKCDARDDDGATPLHIAVKFDSHQGVEALLQNSLCDVKARDNDSRTVMHYASNPSIVKILLEAGAENDSPDSSRQTPLYLAAYRGNFEVAEALLGSEPKPDVNTKDEDDWTLLHAAYDSPSIVKLLLEQNVDPNALSNSGRTPLGLAIRYSYLGTAKLLLEAHADPELARNIQDSPLHMAFYLSGDCLERVQLLADYDADLFTKDSDGKTVLHIAAQEDRFSELEYLVQKLQDTGKIEVREDICASVLYECVSRAEFNSKLAELITRGHDLDRITKPHFILHAACFAGSIDAVKWLLEMQADVNMRGGEYGTALCAAVESEKNAHQKIQLLIKEEANVDATGENQPTALQRATLKADESLIELLLDKGANANLIGGDESDTPLNTAIRGSLSPTIIGMMLSNGADISRPGIEGQLPIHVAAVIDRVEVLPFIISAGADPLSKDTDGRSALMHGVKNRSDFVVKYLLENHDVDREERDAYDQTPLIVATTLGSKSIVNLLLQNGFNELEILNARDHEGKTSLAHATSLDYLEIVKMLLNRGADPCVVDCRDRSPLYWAARAARMETLNCIIMALDNLDQSEIDTIDLWNTAIHGAIASNKQQALERLLEKEGMSDTYAMDDGWTPFYTAVMYDSSRLYHLLTNGLAVLKRPSSWHLNDRSPGLQLEPDNKTLTTVGT